VPGHGSSRAITDFLRWGPRRSDPSKATPASEGAATPDEVVLASKALPRFLTALSGRDVPVLLDLGPVVGSNVAYFGERLGCKLHVEDLYADVERHARSRTLDEFSAFLDRRFSQSDATVDGILCWDVFDYLDRAAAQTLSRHLVRLLRPGGALFGFFCTVAGAVHHYTKFILIDDATVRHRTYAATDASRHVIQNRDIIRMFDGLPVSDSFLLKSNTREILFRKP
jgi:hypothetical protein